MYRSTDKKFMRTMLMADVLTFEAGLSYTGWCGASPGKVFLDTIGELREEFKDVGINTSAIGLHKVERQYSILPTESMKLNKIQQIQLDRALRFCREGLGLDIDKFPLIICDDLGGGLGRADIELKTMYMCIECFEQGTKRVAACLLEEWTHLEHKVGDETVEQKWIYLQQILSLGEQLLGEPL